MGDKRAEILAEKLTDREAVNAWLAGINETCPACIAEVMAQCKADSDARAYYVNRYHSAHDENLHLPA